MSAKLQNSGRCQAITNAGHQCTRPRTTNSIYCWQHRYYDTTPIYYTESETKIVEVQKVVPETKIIEVPEVSNTIQQVTPEVPTVQLNAITGVNKSVQVLGKMFSFPASNLRIDSALEDQNLSSDFEQLGGIGPFTLSCPVGRYNGSVTNFDLVYEKNNYTFTDILSDIIDLYNRNTTTEEINRLIQISRKNSDILSEGLYAEFALRIKRGDQIPLYELNGNRVKIDKIVLDTNNGKFYLVVKNI